MIAAAIVGGFVWAYHHDVELGKKIFEVEIGDPNEAVRDLLGSRRAKAPAGR